MRPIKASTGARSPTSAVRSRAGTACCRQVAGGSAPHLAERSPSLPGSPPTASRAYATSPFDSHRSRRRDWRRGRPAVRTPRGGGRRQWRGDLRRNARSARGRAAATAQEQEAQPGDRRTSQHCAMLPRPGRPGSETCRGPNGSPHASGETSQVRPFFPRGYDDTRRWPMSRNRLGEQLGNWRSGSSLDAEAVEEAIDDELPGRMELIAATAKGHAGGGLRRLRGPHELPQRSGRHPRVDFGEGRRPRREAAGRAGEDRSRVKGRLIQHQRERARRAIREHDFQGGGRSIAVGATAPHLSLAR